MPASSKQQQKFMGMVHALKKGEMNPADASPEVKKAAQSMSDKDAKDFASTSHKGLPRKVKQEILNRLKEYANKMGTDHLGGDDYTSKRKGGLRDFDGYDNVDYNKDMPMDEGFKSEYKGNDGIVWKKGKTRGGVTNFTPYYKGHNIDFGGHNFKTEKELKDFIKNYILSNQLYNKYRFESVNERADYKYLTQTLLDAKPKYNVYYNSGHNKVNIGGVGYDGGDLVKNFNQKPGSSSKIKNNFYYADQDPQKTKKEVEKLSKGKIKVDIQKGYGGKPIPVYIVKESVEEAVAPANWMQGRTSDYHTKLRGKKRDYDDTNFKKDNSGQPDLEEGDLEDAIHQVKKFDKPKDGKLLTIKVINKLKDKRNKSKSASNKQKLQKMIDKIEGEYKKGKYIKEYGQRLDLSYLEDEEARLDGTPTPKDAIDRNLDETMIRRAVDLAQEILPKDTWSRHASDGKKNKEFVKSIVRDLAQLLNRFYKSHDVDVRIKEEVLKEALAGRIGQYTGSSPMRLVPARIYTIKNEKDKEKTQAIEKDLAYHLNTFWKKWNFPYRIDLSKKHY